MFRKSIHSESHLSNIRNRCRYFFGFLQQEQLLSSPYEISYNDVHAFCEGPIHDLCTAGACMYKGNAILTFRYADCTYEYLLDYKEYLALKKDYSASSINQRIAVVKSYVKYSYGCDSTFIQVYISISGVPFSTVPKIQRKALAEETVACLLDKPPATRKGLRDTLIMSLMFDTAIRLDERTVQLMDVYMKEYHQNNSNTDSPLIYTVVKGEVNHMSHRNIQKLLKKYAASARDDCADMPESVYPHQLRRSRATNLYQNGTPLEIISRFQGHSSTETAKDHYAFPSLEQLRNAMNAGNQNIPHKEAALWVDHEDELARICGLR